MEIRILHCSLEKCFVVLLHSHTSLAGISSGKSDRVDGDDSGYTMGDNPLQTEQVQVGIPLLLAHPSTGTLWQGREHTNFAIDNTLL